MLAAFLTAAAIVAYTSQQEPQDVNGNPNSHTSHAHQAGPSHDPMRPVNDMYAHHNPEAPDALPSVVGRVRGRSDTDPRDPHNYPGKPGAGVKNPQSKLEAIFQANDPGFLDTGPEYAATDVRNAMGNQLGMFPTMKRERQGPLTIDPMHPSDFKPPKQVVMQQDMHGEPAKQSNVFGIQNNNEWRAQYYAENTKNRGAMGRYNQMRPGGWYGNDSRAGFGFSTGLHFTPRTGGFHKRERFFKPEEDKSTHLRWRFGNAGQKGLTEGGPSSIGHVRIPYNSFRTQNNNHNVPMPTSGPVANKGYARSNVALPHTNRQGTVPERFGAAAAPGCTPVRDGASEATERGWVAPPGSAFSFQEALRPDRGFQGRDVIPKKSMQLHGFRPGPAVSVEAAKGSQQVTPVVLNRTHREDYLEAYDHQRHPMGVLGLGTTADYNLRTDEPFANCEPTAPGGCRINPQVPRPTKKGDYLNLWKMHAPTSDRTLVTQRTEHGNVEDRRVTPFIRSEIDPSLLNPYIHNPYTPALPLHAQG